MENTQSYTFKAETKQLLNILIHSLYKDKEVFLRELLSNASDALNRLKFELLTNKDVVDVEKELAIHISVDKDKKLITISDNGIGMNRAEIVENLGTIAQSGARNFIELAKQQSSDFSQVIGQFGVGFYSVFMVADSVKVTSRSFSPADTAVQWTASGDETFEVADSNKQDRGTTIEISLKDEFSEFADEYRLREIVHKHSDFIGFPIFIGSDEKQVNKQTAMWRTNKKELTDEQYKDFYRQFTLDFDEPIHTFHNITDAPVQLYSLMFFPSKAERSMFSTRKDDGVKLYSRNILIDEYNKDLLPEYFRFVQGVVDSEDLPLNVSRETIQSSGLLPGLKKVLTGQVFKELENMAKNDSEKYLAFWKEFGLFLKQGIAMNAPEVDKITPLLRFHTSTQEETWTTLDEYIARQPEAAPDVAKHIYYIVGDDPRSIMFSPHLDHYKSQNIEVLLLTEPIDSFMLMGLTKYKEIELKNIAASDEVKTDEEKKEEKEKAETGENKGLIDVFKSVLGEKVADVRVSSTLSTSVARLVDEDGGMNQEMQRVYRYLGKDFDQPKKVLEINTTHPLVEGINALTGQAELQAKLIEQVLDSASILEGVTPDPAKMVQRIQELMSVILEKSK